MNLELLKYFKIFGFRNSMEIYGNPGSQVSSPSPQEVVGHAHHVHPSEAATRVEEIVGTALARFRADAFGAFVAGDGVQRRHRVHADDHILLNTWAENG